MPRERMSFLSDWACTLQVTGQPCSALDSKITTIANQ